MRILYIATNFASLTHTFIAREVDQLRRQGLDIRLLALRPPHQAVATSPECDLEGCLYLYPVKTTQIIAGVSKAIFRRPRRLLRAIKAALASRRDSLQTKTKLLYQLAVTTTCLPEVEQMEPDHLHAHLASPPGSYAMFLSILTGVPFSFTGHAADLYRRPVANDTKLREAAGAVAISEFNLRHYRQVYPELQRAALVHCGLKLDEFAYREREHCHEPLRVLAVGRATEKKGFGYLLTALRLLSDEAIAWQAHIVGGGPLENELQRQRDELKLSALEMTGPLQQAEIKDLLTRADVFVLPCVPAADGDVDGIPVALMEAMASGCPVISTRVSGIPELLDEGQAGLLVAPRDAAEIAVALRRCVQESGLVHRLSQAGREQIASQFNIAVEGRKLEEFFASLGNEKDRPAHR